MDNLKLNETICFYRKKQGFTQEELAGKLGVTNQSVSKWESAQCCPDIILIPKLADIFEISIDELFGKEPKQTVNHHDLCTGFSWTDDETLRVILTRGHKILQTTDDLIESIHVTFPDNCSETTKQYFKVEVFGNICCDASINGDVIGHGKIECNEINGDIRECKENIACQGAINGDVSVNGNLACGGLINGDVHCGDNISCGGNIEGDVDCGNNVVCGGDIIGDVIAGGNVKCKKIEGNVECHGSLSVE